MRIWIHIATIVAVVFTAYWGALHNGFVHDDITQALQNHWITSPGHIPDIFLKNTWGFLDSQSNYYRPMMHLFYMLSYGIFGLNPLGFHLVNIILHAGVTILVYLLVARLLEEGGAASRDRFRLLPLFAAALFAAHPIHTEAVTWVAGIPDVSFTFFGLLSFYLYTLSDKGGFFKGYYTASVAFFLIALFCKEPALVLPAILFAYDYAFKADSFSLSRSLKRLTPFIVAAGVYLAFRFNAIPGVAPRNWHSELSPYQVAINIPPLFARYLEKLILPINLNAFHTFHPLASISDPKAGLSVIVALLYLLLGYIALKKEKLIFLGMCILLFPLLPALYIPALGENVFAERYLYLPSVGFILICVSLLARVRPDNAGRVILAVLPVVMVTGLYCAGTVNRNRVYKDELSLWMDTVKKSPDAALPHNNLGSVFLNMPGYDEEAINQFQIATRLKPDYRNAFNNLGAAYMKIGRPGDAIKAFEEAVKIAPDNATFHNNLGVALRAAKQYDRAVEEFSAAARLDPTNDVIQKHLADAMVKQAMPRP